MVLEVVFVGEEVDQLVDVVVGLVRVDVLVVFVVLLLLHGLDA